jgi:preprotein translocase SecE subunit
VTPVDSQEPRQRMRASWLSKIKVFLADVMQELRMVSFPTWRQTRAQIVIVLIFILVLGLYVVVVDLICQRYLDPILSHR